MGNPRLNFRRTGTMLQTNDAKTRAHVCNWNAIVQHAS